MSHHLSEVRIHEALDGVLSAAEMEGMHRHLDECASCRERYARLSEVVGAIRALPRAASAPESTWAGIRERIEGVDRDGGGAGEPRVVPLPTARDRVDGVQERPASRTVRMSVPQLAAAAAVVALASAGLMRLALGGVGAPAPGRQASEAPAPEVPGGAAARAVSLEPALYGETVARLEAILSEGRHLLAPETLVSIEESLATVDAAIADIEAALTEDPNSDLLRRLLTTHQGRKLGVLERAAGALQTQT